MLNDLPHLVYIGDIVVGVLLWVVTIWDRKTGRMSQWHTVCYIMIAFGLLGEGLLRLSGIESLALYSYMLMLRRAGLYGFVLSVAFKTARDRLSNSWSNRYG